MQPIKTRLTILGATGSIGASTLDVIARHPERYEVVALTGANQLHKLANACASFHARYAVVMDAAAAERLQAMLVELGCETEVLCGKNALVHVATLPEVDAVMAAIVGAAGMPATLAAARAGKKILLANKETLVLAGHIFMQAVSENGATLLPIDSEHNAIFQSLPHPYQGDLAAAGVRRLLLTASGGPFRNKSPAELAHVTPEQAISHPNWSMGRKISVDSASLMNKGLEVIEAHWLFNAPADAIQVVVHPQSVVHSAVEYVDGSVVAQLGAPDMRTPIAYAMAYPERIVSGVEPLDLFSIGRLDFERPDFGRFPCLRLAYEALRAEGAAPAVLNAANEVAVSAFLERRLAFVDIPHLIESVLEQAGSHPATTLEDLLHADQWARGFGHVRIMLLTLFAFLFAIGFLVTVHEYGHYRVAKLFDVKILTFSIGFGRPLLQWQRGETRWQIAMLPLGGYVRMLGEDDDELGDASEAHRQFNRQHPLKKIAIVAAGPAANLLLACLLFAAAMLVGMDAIKPIAGSVRLDSKAAVAGLRSGDEILRVSGRPVQDWDDLRLKALLSVGQQVELDVRSQAGAERRLLLDLQDGAEALYDANVLARLGLSPVPLLNRVAEVETGSVAHRAGLQAGDVIQAIDGMPLRGWEHLQYVVSRHPGQLLQLTVLRGEMPMQFEVTPETIATDGGDVGRLGVAPQIDEASYASQKFVLRQGLLESLYLGSEKAWNLTQMTLRMIGNMLGGSVSASHVSGPVGIASMAGESAGMGLAAYLQYLALVSLSLGVLNLLPVPVLDGGHLLYHSVELLRGKPLPAAWFVMGQRIGIALLLALMVLALYNDIHRFIPG